MSAINEQNGNENGNGNKNGNKNKKLQGLISGAMIAALYVALTLLVSPIAYGPVQLRISESLTLLPWYRREAIPALTIGCGLANVLGGAYGLVDMLLGSGATFVAALLTYWLSRTKLRKSRAGLWFAALPPVVVNMIIIGAMLHVLVGVPLLASCLYIGLGQAAACFGFGVPLMKLLERRGILLQ